MTITDPEVKLLAGISQALEAEYQSESAEWIGSPFAWIDVRPEAPQSWLQPYGGPLTAAITALSKLTGYKVKTVREELGETEA